MGSSCTVPGTGAGFLKGVLDFIDCQTLNIGAGGFAALSDPGSPAGAVLTILVTIFIAVLGLRLLAGEPLGAGVLVPVAVKLGIVLALATSWAAFQLVVYNIVLRGPGELLDVISSPSGLGGAAGLVDRLQAVDDAMVAFTSAGTRSPNIVIEQPSAHIPLADDVAFGISRSFYLVGTVGALGLVRLAAGLLLAISPLVAGLLLFDATRSIFTGWLRMLIATALGSLGITLVLSVTLAFLEPWLTNILALRAGDIPTPSAPIELMIVTVAFAVVAVGMILVAIKVALGIPNLAFAPRWTLSDRRQHDFGEARTTGSQRASETERNAAVQANASSLLTANLASGAANRALLVGDRLPNADMRREPLATRPPTPLGQGHRRTVRRVSLVASTRSIR
ncbi:type IV secretion system protein [Sandaracinobacteroides saxicola]|nr:type IV secretion system protein [Sandaracinobacteroides saxicola]